MNWFEFVVALRGMLKNDATDEAFKQLLVDFGGQHSHLGLNMEERVTEQSRQPYLLSERIHELNEDEDDSDIKDTDSESELEWQPGDVF